MAINPSKLLRINSTKATISASGLRGRFSFLGSSRAKITTSQISTTSLKNNSILDIQKSLTEIIQILTAQNKALKSQSEKIRKSTEARRREGVEGALEKNVGGVLNVAQKIISPVKSLLDRIIDFILAVFIGRSIVKLIRWFSDPQNKTKVRSILRFLGDHWPKLLALYLRFGTGLGRFIGGLSKLLISGALRIAQAAAGLAARAGLKGAGRFSSFLGGRYGKMLATGLEVGTTVAGTMALSKGIENFGGLNDTNIPKFAGGGLANLKKLFKFGGGSFVPRVPRNTGVPGYVSGAKGVDKVPAMLSDGEFVMSRGAVQKYGVDTLESMNAAGGGTNRPKITNGKTYAAGGGSIDKNEPRSFPPLAGNTKIAYNIMKTNFPTAKPFHIAGALANFETEAPGLKPDTYQGGGGPGRGIAQWETPGRWDTAIKKYGPGVFKSLKKQLDYVKYEMDTGNPDNLGRPQLPYGRITKKTWLGSKNLNEATTNFMEAYEAPKITHLEGRLANAKRIMGSIDSSQRTSSTPTSTNRQPSSPNILQRFMNLFGGQPKQNPAPRFSGGVAPQTTSRPSRPLVISASTAKSRTSSRTSVSPPVGFMPEIVYEVVQPAAKTATPSTSGTPQVPSFSASYAGGNANKNATIYGIG